MLLPRIPLLDILLGFSPLMSYPKQVAIIV
jgi:hypothetical protein